MNVHSRCEEDVYTILPNLLPHSPTYGLQNIPIPSRSQHSFDGESGSVVGSLVTLPPRVYPNPGGAVCEDRGWDPKPLYGMGFTRRAWNPRLGVSEEPRYPDPYDELRLLLQAHPRNDLVYFFRLQRFYTPYNRITSKTLLRVVSNLLRPCLSQENPSCPRFSKTRQTVSKFRRMIIHKYSAIFFGVS